jgi:drug/metabolite transporter (DMT)-like permease
MQQKTKAILKDIGGVLLILAGIAFGWLPGPGGIPLVLAGLGLLASNHEWARRWLDKLRDKGSNISAKIFPDHVVAKLVYDIAVCIVIILGILIIVRYDGKWSYSAAITLFALALCVFALNRQRYDRAKAVLTHKA